MTAARTADTGMPVSTTYAAMKLPTTTLRTPRGTRSARSAHSTIPTTTTRWLPDTAMRCAKPTDFTSR